MSQTLKDKNWKAFLFEFLIVVVGIFAGLQADAWYEGLKDRERERTHLEQMVRDFEHNAMRSQDAADDHARIEDELMFAIAVVKRGRVTEEEYERFKWAILTMYQYPPAGVASGAYDALIASGDLAILGDAEFKSRLVQAHSIAKLENYLLEKHSDNWDDGEGIRRSSYAIGHPSGRGVEWHVDYELLISDRQTLGALANHRRSHGIVKDYYLYRTEDFTWLHERAGQLLNASDD